MRNSTAAPPGSDDYYSLRKLKKNQRQDIENILTIFDALLYIPIHVSEDSIAHAKLQWWAKEIINIERQQGSHPISQPLYHTMKSNQLNFNAFLQCIHSIENTIQNCHFGTEQELRNYYTYTYGIRERMIAKITLPNAKEYSQAIYHFAYCLGMIETLKNLRFSMKKMYVFFSEEELTQLVMNKAELFSLKTTDNAAKLIQYNMTKAEQAFTEGVNMLDKFARKKLRCTITRCKLGLAWCNALKTENYQILEKKVMLTPIHKLLITLF